MGIHIQDRSIEGPSDCPGVVVQVELEELCSVRDLTSIPGRAQTCYYRFSLWS